MFHKALVRPRFFQADPEAAHERALHLAGSPGRCRIARDINRGLLRLPERDGFGSMAGAVGRE